MTALFEKIEAQQKGIEGTAAWMVGEQLKEICAGDPHCVELVEKDLDNESMSIQAAEKKIKAYADAHRKGNCAVVPPNVAEDIIREFYGLPGRTQTPPLTLVKPVQKALEETAEVLDLSAFF